MAVNSKFGLFSIDGGVSYVFDDVYPARRRRPTASTWKQEPVDEAADGTQIHGRYAEAFWDFSGYDNMPTHGIPVAQYDLFGTLRQVNGTIRFETLNNLRQWVVCIGIIDLIQPATIDRANTRASGLKVKFTRVLVVG